ncbi:MAG: polyphosphate kinase 1, partial [Trueperaceae bacterium]|nr:polyphosphate kinase 1 [Trueperaceae bacterium]
MPAAKDLSDPSLYLNRELSWLAFNLRVLDEARDPDQPLLERLKFLAIFGSNLDEFMMIRYAGLKDQFAAGVTSGGADDRSPEAQLAAVSGVLHPMVREHRRVLREDVLPALARHGVVIRDVADLDGEARATVDRFWDEELFPVLTPLGIDARHPFPRLPNLSFSLLVALVDLEDGAARTAIVQVPSVLPRFVRLPGPGYAFAILEDLIRYRVAELFPGHAVQGAHGFRLTRDADIAIAEDEADDLLRAMEDEVRRRRWGDAVRLEVATGMPAPWREQLRTTLGVAPEDVYDIPNHLNVADFMELASLPIPELRDPPFQPRMPRQLTRVDDPFEAIRASDVLLHHPFHAFDAVLRLLEAAADDPDVLAIKQTLYRVGRQSPVVAALARAAGNGKLVTALVELKARFDEENNIVWARELERAGVHVVYGFASLKTHAKALLVVRREPNANGGSEIRRYVHLGTGNYNPGTAGLYTDMGLLTCDPELGADVSELFNVLTGFSKQRAWRKLWVAPETLRPELLAAIEREAAHARAGRPARIIAKMNSLVDPEVIRELYRASQAGVDVDLIVRGICCLRPGVPGVSERISVRSIVGRFLEHARVAYFHDDGAERIYLGSADWMQRNLNGRVEAVFPIEDPRVKREVMAVLELELRDNVKARALQPDGTYVRVRRRPGQRRLESQKRLLERSARRG